MIVAFGGKMNEQIRKLAEEAGFYFYDMHNVNGEDLGETIEADSWSAADKFAELIVGECVRYFNEDYQRDFEVLWKEDLTKGMKKHFGVK